jgi:hypothetical protein
MYLMGNGINYSTGSKLIEDIDEVEFGNRIKKSLSSRGSGLRSLTRASAIATTFRSGIEGRPSIDLGDPKAAGWTFLVNEKDPDYKAIVEAIRPLAEFRGMQNPDAPLMYSGEPMEEWFDWIQEKYFWPSTQEMKEPPHYILIAGSPDMVPFLFQSFLDCAASVGRVDFNSLNDLKTYVEKVIRLENTDPVVSPEVMFFAPDGGTNDPTHFSRRFMAEPLVDFVRTKCNMKTRTLMGDDATKENLLETLTSSNPALVYTASHGLAAPGQSLNVQEHYNGAICCQDEGGYFTGFDVPTLEPFLEGSIFFQFACFGYGTPKESEYSYWLEENDLVFEKDFVAALPKRLLAHPRGPIAYIGHMDTAMLHGFDDPDNPEILERWHPRMEPFVKAVEMLLHEQPAGLAMTNMNKRYDLKNAQLSTMFDLLKKGTIKETREFFITLANAFLIRSDAQNYMVLGDPAARPYIPK